MAEPFHLLDLQGMAIYEQLQLEEALLRADDRNWCIVNRGSPEGIILGISSKYVEHINPIMQSAKRVPIIRRCSGGGVVYIDQDTHFYTLIGNRANLPVPCTPQELLSWSERLYAPAFKDISFSLRENDYVIGERKFGGNAQYLCKERWLHHSSLLWDYRPKKMEYLLMPPKMPTYREKREHKHFLCRLADYFPSPEFFQNQMVAAVGLQYPLIPIDLKDVLPILEKDHRRATMRLEE